MPNISYNIATDREVLETVGERLQALRRARGLTQGEAAERGETPTLLTVVRLLRVYGRLAALEGFIPPLEISPMARLRERRGADLG